MKAIFTFAIIFSSLVLTAQSKTDNDPGSQHKQFEKMNKEIDSSMKALDSLNATINWDATKTVDSINNHLQQEQNNRNLDAFMRMQKEQQEKEKKTMYMRLGLGVFFLGVLIFGIVRRRRKATK